MSTVFYDYTIKEKGHSDMHFLIKAEDGIIADVIVPFEGDKSDENQCINYRLENGSAKEAFWGMDLGKFRQRFECSPHVRVGDVLVSRQEIERQKFHEAKILENQIMSHGKCASWKFLLNCIMSPKEGVKEGIKEIHQIIDHFAHRR